MIKTEYLNLRQDLQNGMSIEDGLQKHNLTLKDAFLALQFKDNRPVISPSKTNEFYIQQNIRGHYFVYKYVEGKQTHFGTYTTLPEAVKIRNWFIENGWNKDKIDHACKECGVKRRKKDVK